MIIRKRIRLYNDSLPNIQGLEVKSIDNGFTEIKYGKIDVYTTEPERVIRAITNNIVKHSK